MKQSEFNPAYGVTWFTLGHRNNKVNNIFYFDYLHQTQKMQRNEILKFAMGASFTSVLFTNYTGAYLNYIDIGIPYLMIRVVPPGSVTMPKTVTGSFPRETFFQACPSVQLYLQKNYFVI